MKHLLILILLCASVSLYAQDNKQQTTKQQTTQVSTKKPQQNVEYVYICNGPSSKKYHKPLIAGACLIVLRPNKNCLRLMQ